MEWLTKLLFPNNPKMVRYRKIQALFIAVLLIGAICAAVGVLMYLVGTDARF